MVIQKVNINDQNQNDKNISYSFYPVRVHTTIFAFEHILAKGTKSKWKCTDKYPCPYMNEQLMDDYSQKHTYNVCVYASLYALIFPNVEQNRAE